MPLETLSELHRYLRPSDEHVESSALRLMDLLPARADEETIAQ
jgi:hypothetical protein